MMKSLRLLLKAGAAEAEATVFEHTGVIQIQQRIEEAVAVHARACHELAAATAHGTRERRALEGMARRIADLEGRAREALAKGRDDLAEEAARAIATLENERETRDQALRAFDVRLERLRLTIENGAARISALRRGLEAARAAQALHRVAGSGGCSAAASAGALGDAEAMLRRLEDNLAAADELEEARRAAARSLTQDDLVERLSDAGCGKATGVTAAAVMARLRAAATQTLPAA